MFILRGMRSTLDMSCCRFFANRIVRAASSGDSVHIAVSFWMAGAAFCEDPFRVEISSAFGFLGWSCFNDKTTGSSLSLGALVALHSDDHCKYL